MKICSECKSCSYERGDITSFCENEQIRKQTDAWISPPLPDWIRVKILTQFRVDPFDFYCYLFEAR